MTSAIDNTFLSTINENFPVAGAYNSTQPFRDNYARIKDGFATAGKELTYLQGKKIELIGDATGISGVLGNSLNQPTPITLTLTNTAVTAGTYSTSGNVVAFTVDAKGRLTNVVQTAIPLRPAVVGTFVGATISTTASGTVKSMRVPTLTVDNMGTITAASNNGATFNFGIMDHPLTKGSLVVGNTAGQSKEFVVPVASYNPADLWVLSWRPEVGNDLALQWYKLPAANPLNPAQVIDITAGLGINVSTDIAHPTVAFDYSTFPDFVDPVLDTQGTILFHDFVTNTEYKMPITRLFEAQPVSQPPLYALVDDPEPQLGGDLNVGIYKIQGTLNQGLVLEVFDTKPLVISHVRSYDPTDTTIPPVQQPEANWIYTRQTLPSMPPVFSVDDTAAGITSSYLKAGADGNMYWSPEPEGGQFVSELFPGIGISFDVPSSITNTGTINVDTSALPLQDPDIFSDSVMLRDYTAAHFQTPVSSLTWTLPNVLVVDPINAIGDFVPGFGQLHAPFQNIISALASIDDSPIVDPEDPTVFTMSNDIRYVFLMPGLYNESFSINKRNVQLISLMGPDATTIAGEVTIDAHMGKTVMQGLTIDIARSVDQDVDPVRCITSITGIEGLIAENCNFSRPGDAAGRHQSLMLFQGLQQGAIHFNNCQFNGIVQNELEIYNPNMSIDHWFRITNTRGDRLNMVTVITGNSVSPKASSMEIAGANIIQQVKHLSGALTMKNIGAVHGDWSDAVWASIDPTTTSPVSTGIAPEGIVSTAPSSASAPHNFLALTNVNMHNFRAVTNQYFSSAIVKTGGCEYLFSNVQRDLTVDNITAGGRFAVPGTNPNELNNQIVKLTGQSGTVAISAIRAPVWDVTITGDTTFNLYRGDNATTPLTGFAHNTNIKLIIRQDSVGGHTVAITPNSGTFVWNSGSAPAFPTAGNEKILYEFSNISDIWFGKRF